MKWFLMILAFACVPIWVAASLEHTHVNHKEDETRYHCSPGAGNTPIPVRLHIDDLIDQALNKNLGIKMVISADGPVGLKISHCGGPPFLQTVDPIDFEYLIFERSWIPFLKFLTEGTCLGEENYFTAEFDPLGHCSGRLTVNLTEEAPTKKDSPDSTDFTFPIDLQEGGTTKWKVSMGNALEKALHAPHHPHEFSSVSLIYDLTAPLFFRFERCGFMGGDVHLPPSPITPLRLKSVGAMLLISQLRCYHVSDGNSMYMSIKADRATQGMLGFQFNDVPDMLPSTTTTTQSTETIQSIWTTEAAKRIALKSRGMAVWMKTVICLVVIASVIVAVFFWDRRSQRLEAQGFGNPVHEIPLDEIASQ